MKSDTQTREYIDYMNRQGVTTIDYVANSPRRFGATWKKRDVNGIIGMCYHQALGNTNVDQTIRYQIGSNSHFKNKPPSGCYTGFVSKNGTYYIINNLRDRTWSQGTTKTPGDENALYFAVCFQGAFTYPNMDSWSKGICKEPSAAQLKAASGIWLKSQEYFKWDNGMLLGHYHFGKRACPGTELEKIVEHYRSLAPAGLATFELSTLKGMQRALESLGYNPGPADGIMGVKTQTAIKNFQEDCGITVDGIPGPNTRRRLEIIYNKGKC